MIDLIVGALFYFAVILKCLILAMGLCYKSLETSRWKAVTT